MFKKNVFKVSKCLTCWAEPEMSISQHHKQQLPAEKLRDAQRDVSELGVRIIPPVTRSAAEPPQQRSLQSSRDKHTELEHWTTLFIKLPALTEVDRAHLQLKMV